MKTICLLLILGLISIDGYAQRQKLDISHYVFPEFVKGTVLMKSGVKNEAMLNYNSLTEEMIFDNNGTKLTIGMLEQVDTVYIEGRKFFPQKAKFIELAYHGKCDLYIEHKCSLIEPGKPAAYGGTSQTSSTTMYSSIISGGQAYALKLPDGYGTKPYLIYWLKKEGKPTTFMSLKQLSKLFSEKSAQFKQYVKDNKVSLEDPESVIGLLKYLEKN
jgi:hypothetical protein